MITEISVEGYKRLAKCDFVGLKRVNLIGGRNNSGKTSLLESIFLSQDWGNADLLTRHLTWRGLAGFAATSEAWSHAFTNYRVAEKIQIKTRLGNGDRFVFAIQTQESPIRIAPPSRESKQSVRSPGEPTLRITCTQASKTVLDATVVVVQGVPPFVINYKTYATKPPTARFNHSREAVNAAEDAELFGRLDKERRTDEIVKSLQLMEPRLRGLSVVPQGPVSQIFGDVEGLSRKVPINLLGDGTTRLLSTLLQISTLQNGYLLIDEIENGYHYSVMPKIWQVLYDACKSNRCQLFATTHSYECLTSFAETLGETTNDDYSYIRLDSKEGRVETIQYDAEALRNATAGGWEVR